MSDSPYEVVIVGAGPAGATAAILMAQKGHRVELVDRETFPREVACAGWLNARSVPLLTELGVAVKPLLNRAFHDVTFYRADFSQTAKPRFENAPGYLIDRAQFEHALITTAVDKGVSFVQGCAVTDLRLKESSILAKLPGGRIMEGRLLLLAAGRGSPLFDRVGLTGAMGESPIWSVQVDARLTSHAAPPEPRVGVILGLDRAGSFGLCCVSTDRMSIGVNCVGERGEAVPALVHLCRRAFEHEVVPVDLSDQARETEPLWSPASAALDMDSHVGKHTLVIGDAGGFIAAASNEGIYPAMWSAQIATEVADKALHSVHSQDELMTFDSIWRMRMADYLRSPHTDVQFLLPLIFSNQSMADR
ncbi:MAG: FAD-dependent monooxygenase, partial [Phycisphaerae bacterium]